VQNSSRFGVALLLTVLCSGFTTAQEKRKPLPLEQLEEMKGLESILNNIDRLKAQMETVGREKRAQCLRGIGNSTFCECFVSIA